MVVKPPGQASVWNQYGTLSGNTAGASTFSGTNIVLQGGPNVTLCATGGTVVVSGAAGGTGAIGGIALGAGTNTATGGTVVFQNSNGVSWGQDTGGHVTATVRTDYQSAGAYLTTAQPPGAYLTTAQPVGNYAGINGSITGGSITVNTSGVSVALPAYLTTAQPVGAYLTTAQPVGNYAGVNGSIAGGSLTLNTSGATISLPNYLTTAQPVGNYAGTNSGATGCSVTVNTSGVSVNAPVQSAQPMYYSASGTSSASGTLQFSNSNGVTWGLTNGAVIASVATSYLASNASTAYMLTGERGNYFYTSNNTFANSTHTHGSAPSLTGPVSATSNSGAWSLNVGAIGTGTSQTNVTWTVGTAGFALNASGYAGTVTGATNCSVTANSNGVSVNVGAGGGEATISRWVQPFQMTNAGQLVNGSSVSFVPFVLQAPLACSGVRFAMSVNGATTTNNTSGGMTMSASVVLYTRNVSTLSSINSGSFGTSTWATSNATGSMFGARQLSISFANSTLLTPGDYWLALHVSTATAGNTSLAKSISMAIGPDAGQSFLVLPAFGTSAVTTRAALMGLGIHSTGATRGTLAFSDMTGMAGTLATLANLWFELRNYSVY